VPPSGRSSTLPVDTHTVRGAFAGAHEKKLGLTVISGKVEGSSRVYRSPDTAKPRDRRSRGRRSRLTIDRGLLIRSPAPSALRPVARRSATASSIAGQKLLGLARPLEGSIEI
jgi:hypothetical protein